MGIEIDIIGGENIDQIVRDLDALGPAARRALIRTVRKVSRSAATQAARDIAKRSDVPVRALTQDRGRRVFARVPDAKETGPLRGSIWVGYNPISARAVGQLRQDEGGAWARRYYFKSGFLATMPSGYRSIFQRTGRDRTPIAEGTVALTVAEPVLSQIARASRARLRDVLVSELNFELNVKGRT